MGKQGFEKLPNIEGMSKSLWQSGIKDEFTLVQAVCVLAARLLIQFSTTNLGKKQKALVSGPLTSSWEMPVRILVSDFNCRSYFLNEELADGKMAAPSFSLPLSFSQFLPLCNSFKLSK